MISMICFNLFYLRYKQTHNVEGPILIYQYLDVHTYYNNGKIFSYYLYLGTCVTYIDSIIYFT